MRSQTPFHERPALIGNRLDAEFDDVDPEAKRLWALIIQLSILFRELNVPKIKAQGVDLNRGEIIILTALRVDGHPYQLRQTEITERVQMSSGGVTNTCRSLNKRGLIERRRDEADSRVTLYSLTPEGVELINGVIPIIHSTEKQLSTCLNPVELATLCGYLERLTRQF
ncbi:MAG: MarR family transcriptional regulator [Pseudomonadota bacterium]